MMFAKQNKCMVLTLCHNEVLVEKIAEATKNLESITREMNSYLEIKRELFSRFYFLSNQDLFEIKSLTQEPAAVQPHLKKIFENIARVRFDDNMRINAIYSEEGEELVLPSSIET